MSEAYEFDNQRPDEEVILVRRRHPWVLVKTGLLEVFLGLLILIAFMIWGASAPTVYSMLILLAIAMFFGIGRWLIYANDIFILTNQRIINIEQANIFSRRVSETNLGDIANVAYEIKGIVKTLLNFGEVLISSVGDDNSIIILKNIENPHFVQEKISELRKHALE